MSAQHRSRRGRILLGAGLLLVAASVEAQRSTGDFNGDGYSDLAIGAPGAEVGIFHGAGTVSVIYGSPGVGLSTLGNQLWHQDSPDIIGSPFTDAHFGASFATGDFDNDGYDDLAIGVPGYRVGAMQAAGAINVLYGSPLGLTSVGNQLFRQGNGVTASPEAGDMFGYALAAGDFNNDGYSDIAIGVPGEAIGGVLEAGVIHALYGTAAGLSSTGQQTWHQDIIDILEEAETGDHFGAALAVGDFDDDRYDDLAIGVPGESIYVPGQSLSVRVAAGGVNVIYGHWYGLRKEYNQFWSQDSPLIFARSEDGDAFGTSLAAGDFNGDFFDDLAVGVPYDDLKVRDATIYEAGGVNVIYGFHDGLHEYGNQYWHQNTLGIPDVGETHDFFGWSLAAGDFDGDGYDDLGIGVCHETIRGLYGAGAAHVLYGTNYVGLDVPGNQFWHQGVAGVLDRPEPWDQFGFSMTSGDFNGDGRSDLAVGVPNESIGARMHQAGLVNVFYGFSISGLSVVDNQVWHKAVPGILGAARVDEFFGAAGASTR